MELTIVQLYTYPIKSLREVPLTSTEVTKHGFPYDRRFILQKVHAEDASSGKKAHNQNMTITYFPAMSLFLQEIRQEKGENSSDILVVTYRPPNVESKQIEVPLAPYTDDLEMMEVNLHNSPTKAFKMANQYNEWFSSCFGYAVILAYLGPHHRAVLGNLSPNISKQPSTGSSSWMSSITSRLPALTTGDSEESVEDGITFADVSAYLVVTEESLQDISSRLPEGEQMNMTKFRPNIVISGAPRPWDEDYWGGISISSPKAEQGLENINLDLTQNCARCVSINVDYETGEAGKGESGAVLKKMMKDRRIDHGAKWSPIFGRYGFLLPAKSAGRREVAIGDKVEVTKVNSEKTTFGMSRVHQLSKRGTLYATENCLSRTCPSC